MDDCLCRAGFVVPKRHVRRAVSRALVKREARAACLRHAPALLPGSWLIRLRAPFDRQCFRSAASVVLRQAVRSELDHLLGALA